MRPIAIENVTLPLRYFREKVRRGVTYAQHEEDLVAREILGCVRRFIDVGANDGRTLSNTFGFALSGASGLCFEPVPEMFQRLRWLYALNLCSDEPIDEGNFRDLSVRTAPSNALAGLYALAGCDLIIGPVSTFSEWAAFVGDIPRIQLWDRPVWRVEQENALRQWADWRSRCHETSTC